MKYLSSLQIAATAALLALASACTSVTFKQQDLAFDFDAKTDSLTMELEYLDVGPVEHTGMGFFSSSTDNSARFTKAHEFVSRVAKGDPIFIAFMPYSDWDLEELGWDSTVDEDLRRYLRQIFVVEARASLGANDHLNLYQKIHFPNLSRGLELVNGEIRKQALATVPRDRTNSTPMRNLEARNEEIFLADAKAGKDWVVWTEAGLEVSLPFCSQYTLELMRELLIESNEATGEELKDGVVFLRQAFAAAKDFRIEADHVVLVFGDENGDLNFSFKDGFLETLPDYRDGFVKHLKDEGMTFPTIYSKGE